MYKWRILVSVVIVVTLLTVLKSPHVYGQEDFTITVDTDMSQIGAFAWANDNRTLVFLNNALAPQPPILQVDLNVPAWQTFNVETQTLSPGQAHWPLQPELSPNELTLFSPLHFILPSPDNDLLAFSRQGEGGYFLTFANRMTDAFVLTPLTTNLDTFFTDRGLKGYWSQTGNAFVFPQTSPFTTEVTYHHIRVNPTDLLATVIRPFSFRLSDNETYVTFDATVDRLLDLSESGDHVLLIARKSSSDPMNPTSNQIPYLVIWSPETPSENQLIPTFMGEDICNAAFSPLSNTITLIMRDGSILLYNFSSRATTRLAPSLASECSFTSLFSRDGQWVAIITRSQGKLEFIDIEASINQAGPTLQPPVANAGEDVVLVDSDGDGIGEITVSGEQSFDPDGEIVSYIWSQGAAQRPEGAIQTLLFPIGATTFTLTVTDNDGLHDVDEVIIFLEPLPTPSETATNTPTPTFTPTPSQTCTVTVAAGDAVGLVNAINAANNNGASADTICLEEGTYTFLSASNAIALPSIATPITIVGNSAIIERGSGAPNFRLFNVTSSGALTLEDLTLRNGNASGSNGGAILNAGSLTLDGVTLENNTARFGGGIHSSGSLVIIDSTLVTNSAVENGGAVYVNSGTLTLSDTTLESSSARYGSGIYLNNGTADLTGVIARANHATEQGAGVYQRTGTLTISGGLFENNTARFGNGVYVDAGTATISDVTMRENVAVEEGAGIYNRTGTVSVTDSIFGDNQARYGAAISNRGTVSIAGSVFTGNSVQESGGAVYTTRSTSGNQVQQSCFEGNSARIGGAVFSSASGFNAAVFSSASGFNARDNWWGEVTGPTGAMVNGNVLTEPFLMDGCPR